MSRQYDDEQYFEEPDYVLNTGFTNYDRLLIELNNRMYYDKAVYEKFLNENALNPNDTYDKNTDHAQLLETVYAIFMNNLELDENGEVLNAKYAEHRAAQYIKQWCIKEYIAEPTFEGSEELELY